MSSFPKLRIVQVEEAFDEGNKAEVGNNQLSNFFGAFDHPVRRDALGLVRLNDRQASNQSRICGSKEQCVIQWNWPRF